MSEEHGTKARRRLKDFAARAVAAAKTATSATSATAAKAAATVNSAAAKAAKAAAAVKAAPAGAADPAADSDAPDDRDDVIARLEQELEAERAKTHELEGNVKALGFKLDVLERSYGKQLADARADADGARHELSEIKARLAETTQELKQVAAVRDRLHDMFAFDGRRVPPELRDRSPGDEDTIARLLSMADSVPDPDSGQAGLPPERARGEPEPTDLLAPELVFDANDDRDDDRHDDGEADRKAVRG